MRFKLAILLFLFGFISTFTFAQEKVSIPGFGELPVVQNGDVYQITLDKFGTFDFKGTLLPFDLEATVQVEELRNFPGYPVMANLGLQDIVLKVSTAGVFIGAKADTKKSLKVLFDFLGIDAPYLLVNSKISKTSFALESTLDFSQNPVIIDVIPPAGTQLQLSSFSLLAGAGAGGAAISVITEMRVKPTKWDPALKSKFEFSYDLRTQEISGSGSMIDTWTNPFGLDKHLGKDAISFTNTAVALGWIPGAPTPTTLGFAVENATFFDLEFGSLMSISPANGEIALKASRNKITMNDFTSVLRGGFGLKIPDIFPKDIYIRDVEILFSPNGGQVGEIEIESGFAMKGKAKLLEAVEADLDYSMSLDAGYRLDFNINANLKKALMNEIRKVKPLAPVMDQILSTFQLRKVNTHMEAGTDLKLDGKTHVAFEVFGKSHSFTMKAALDPKIIIDAIIDKLLEQGKIIEVAGQVSHLATDAGKTAVGMVNNIKDFAGEYKDDIEHLPHSWDKCKNECIPKLARNKSNPVWDGSNIAVWEFYSKVYPELIKIEGSSTAETKKLRKDLVWNDWLRLANTIDSRWQRVRKDGTCKGYKCKCDKYKKLVDQKHNSHKNLRKRLWHQMMTDKDNKFDIYHAQNLGDQMYLNIPGYHVNGNRKNGTKVSVWTIDKGIDRVIKMIPDANHPGYFYIQLQHSEKVFDIVGNGTNPGANVQLWSKSDGNGDQLFKLVEVDGRADTYYIQSKIAGLYLTSNGKGELVTVENAANTANQQWYFKKISPYDIAPPTGGKYRIRTMAVKGRYLDIPGYGPGTKGKDAYVQLWNLDNGSDRTLEIERHKKTGLYTLQPLHSKYVLDVEGRSEDNGARIQLYTNRKGSNQLFQFLYAGEPMVYNIVAAHSGKLIDASRSKIHDNGCPVQQWSANGGDNQQWKLEPIIPTWGIPPAHQSFLVRNVYSDKYWDIGGRGAETNKNGNKIKMWTLDDGADRKYRFIRSGDADWINIQCQNGGKYLDVVGTGGENGKKIQLWDKTGKNDQKFAIEIISPTTFIIRTKAWKCIDTYGNSYKGNAWKENGRHLQTNPKGFDPDRIFQLIYADGPKKGQAYQFELE
ncbi:MAG: RICIN domain-containing protein [Salinivirgaceae bacterium]|jgi:hypothetical protein|nr:RICIN domain-containing protein [Salinivirgaceae bacterium]